MTETDMHQNTRTARFAAEYVVDHNATRAAVRAGYPAKWGSVRGLYKMRRPAVRLAIAEREAILLAGSDLTPERVLREVARVAFADLGRLYAPDGRLLPVPVMDDDTLAGVESIQIYRTRTRRRIRVRALDKTRALAMLGRYFRRNAPTIEGEVLGESFDGALAAALKRAP